MGEFETGRRSLTAQHHGCVSANERLWAALLGPVIAGVSVGVHAAEAGGGGRILLGLFVGLGIGVTLMAFVSPAAAETDRAVRRAEALAFNARVGTPVA